MMSRRQTRVGPSKWGCTIRHFSAGCAHCHFLRAYKRPRCCCCCRKRLHPRVPSWFAKVVVNRWRWDIHVDQSEILRFDSVSSCAVEVPQTFVPPNLSLLSILLGAKHGPQAPPTLNEVNLGEQVYLPEREKKKYRGSVKSARFVHRCIDPRCGPRPRDLGTSRTIPFYGAFC